MLKALCISPRRLVAQSDTVSTYLGSYQPCRNYYAKTDAVIAPVRLAAVVGPTLFTFSITHRFVASIGIRINRHNVVKRTSVRISPAVH